MMNLEIFCGPRNFSEKKPGIFYGSRNFFLEKLENKLFGYPTIEYPMQTSINFQKKLVTFYGPRNFSEGTRKYILW
jgi:hypothetical protein